MISLTMDFYIVIIMISIPYVKNKNNINSIRLSSSVLAEKTPYLAIEIDPLSDLKLVNELKINVLLYIFLQYILYCI